MRLIEVAVIVVRLVEVCAKSREARIRLRAHADAVFERTLDRTFAAARDGEDVAHAKRAAMLFDERGDIARQFPAIGHIGNANILRPHVDREDLIASSNIPPERVQSFALLEVDDGLLSRIVEKPTDADMPGAGEPMLVSMNCWRFDSRIFSACRDVEPSPRGEFELPIAVGLALRRGVQFRAVPARGPVLDLSRRADTAEVARRLRGAPLAP